MGDQQSKSSQPNWFVTGTIGGVVRVIVNHFDGIVATILIHVHLPSFSGSPVANFLNAVSSVLTLLGAGTAALQIVLPRKTKKIESIQSVPQKKQRRV